jgi:acyl-CoA thioesterase-1
MSNLGLGCVIALGLIGLVWWLYPTEPTLTNYPPPRTTIVFFGDSLVEGVGAAPGQDLPSQLSRQLGRSILNFGVAGDTTAAGLERLPDALAAEPGLVFILLGGNDFLRRVPLAVTEENLRRLVTEFQRTGAVVVVIGVRDGVLRGDAANMYERVTEDTGSLLIPDVLSPLLLKPEFMADAIHPNAAGYGVIAETLAEVVHEYKLLATRP